MTMKGTLYYGCPFAVYTWGCDVGVTLVHHVYDGMPVWGATQMHVFGVFYTHLGSK